VRLELLRRADRFDRRHAQALVPEGSSVVVTPGSLEQVLDNLFHNALDVLAPGGRITLEGAARQVTRSDFEDFDLLVAMDRDNLADLRAIAPAGTEGKVRLLLDGRDVPDPYYGGPRGFEEVLDLVQDGCERLLDDLAP
jgi:protein-tyrosine-phosphatase